MSSALTVRNSGEMRARPDSDTRSGVLDVVGDKLIIESAEEVLESWTNERGDARDKSEVKSVLVDIVKGVGAAESGDPIELADETRSPLGEYVLQELRSKLLAGLDDPQDISTGRLLRLLKSIEEVRSTLEPGWSELFNSRLSGPGSLDLVVQVAHDLRSPLTSILFLAETLQRGQSGEVNDLQSRQLGLIYGAALGLSSVTSDVIEIARGGDRLVDDDLSPFSIREIFESVADIVRPIAEEKGLEIKLSLPPGDHRLGHPIALSRVLLNLTTNSLKFTEKGHVSLTAEASGMRDVVFSVADTGPGINPAAIDCLYQPFRRAQGREGYAVSGTGLGLAICRKLVEAMGSKLVLETDPSWGTRFSFQLEIPPANHL